MHVGDGANAMRYLADEHIPRSVVQALRSLGHDVLWAAETGRQLSDATHIATADAEDRMILTEDSDFTDLIAEHRPGSPLIYFRLNGLSRDAKVRRMIDAVIEIGHAARDTIHVVEPSRIRVRGASS